MRKPTITTLTITITITITTITALTAITSIATAAFPRYLPSNGGTFPVNFTGFGGKSTLAIRGGGEIACEGHTGVGQIINNVNINVTTTYNNCTVFGILNAHSLGDPANTILVTGTGLLCEISAGVAGLVLTPTGRVHLEASGVLTIVEGSVIGVLTPASGLTSRFELKLKAKAAGEQEQLKCAGGAETHLNASESEGTLKAASEVSTGVVGILGTTGEIMT